MQTERMRNRVNQALKLIYPDACPLCEELMAEPGRACKECIAKLCFVGEVSCARCGKPIEDEEQEYCNDCGSLTRSFIRGYPAMEYTDEIRSCLMRFKYGSKKGYAGFLASMIIKSQGTKLLALGADALVPVPVHRTRLKERGYNQAKLLADELSGYLGIPVRDDILLRQHKTLPQKELNNIEREKNLKKAFISRVNKVEYKRVILVDDIYTTGATIEGCTRVLHSIGIPEVFYTSVCIGKGY